MSHIHKKIKLDIREGVGGRQKQLDTRPATPSASDHQQPPAAQSLLDPAHDALAEMPHLVKNYPQEDAELLAKHRECLQLFYLARHGNDATYDWYKDRVEPRLDGTCKWFLQHELFQEWLLQESGPLLISADPGCGKSVLTKYLIDDGLAQQPAAVCYFFFRDQDQNTVRQALCALLHQLFSQKHVLIQHAMELYNKMGAALVQSETYLWTILRDAVSDAQAGPVIFVVDALDECVESQLSSLMANLKDIFCDQQRKFAKFKVLMTSRPYERVVSEFHSLQAVSPPIHIRGEEESETIREEVNSVIHHRVEQLAKTHQLSDKIKSSLASKLLAIDHRTYLWVRLVFDHLEKRLKKAFGIDAAIQTLPKSVNEAYDQILNRSKDDESVKAIKKALSIILAARRPLTLSEMNIAMRLNDQRRGQSIYDLDLEQSVDLKSLYGLFFSVHDDKVSFFHQTAREFLIQSSASTAVSSHLQWHHSITTSQAHSVLADICMLYLDRLNSTDTGVYRQSNHYSALLEYSVEHWGDHCREAELENGSAMVDLTSGQYTPDVTSHSQWDSSISRRYHIRPESLTNVLISSHLELTSVTKLLLSRGADIEAKDSRDRTALVLAAEACHESTIRLLLKKGANVEARDADGWTALICATIYNREAVVRLLLENGASVEARDNYGWTALMHAARYDLRAVTRLLLVFDANVKARDEDGGTALILAAKYGHEAVIRMLLENGADVEAKDSCGWTVLMHAVRSGHEAIVQLLFENDADLETADDDYSTPLILAAIYGHEAVTRLLLENGVDVEATDIFNMSALLYAVEAGHEAVTRLLLDNDANVDAGSSEAAKALMCAVGSGHEAVIRLLIENGADIEAMGYDNGTTALMLAAKRGHEAVTRVLLETDVYVDETDEHDMTPLMIAAEYGHEAISRLLLETGPDVEAKDVMGWTALILAAKRGNEAVVRLLLENGANVEAKEDEGWTPLIVATRDGHEAVIRLLLEHGADIEAKDNNGWTALRHAAESTAQVLLDNGAQVEA